MMDMMEMYFHFRIDDPILFRQWKPQNTSAYALSCAAVFTIAFFLELLKFGRIRLIRKPKELGVQCICSTVDGIWEIPELKYSKAIPSIAPFSSNSISDWKHFVSSVLHFVQNFLDYSLMLVAMTYNFPIFFSLLGGHALGFFFVGPLMSIRESEAIGNCCS